MPDVGVLTMLGVSSVGWPHGMWFLGML